MSCPATFCRCCMLRSQISDSIGSCNVTGAQMCRENEKKVVDLGHFLFLFADQSLCDVQVKMSLSIKKEQELLMHEGQHHHTQNSAHSGRSLVIGHDPS